MKQGPARDKVKYTLRARTGQLVPSDFEQCQAPCLVCTETEQTLSHVYNSCLVSGMFLAVQLRRQHQK
jgi:hypothetical protein